MALVQRRIAQHPFAKNEWIFVLDFDEVMSPVLLETLRGIHLQDRTVYWVKRESSYRGRRVRHYSWGSERIPRFYNPSVTAFSNAHIHEDLIVKGLEKLGVGPGMIRLHLSR